VRDRPPPFLFDLDGTLADTLADIAASANHVRQSFGLPAADLPTIQSHVGQGAPALLRLALAELRLPDDAPQFAVAYERYAAHHERQCTQHARAYPGVVGHLQRLAAAGHPLAVVTNKPERFARAILAHLGLAELLPVVVGGDTLPRRKPDPAPLLAALQQLGAAGQGGTMVGDGVTDLRAGKAAGLRTIACLYGYRPAAELLAEGADGYWRAFGKAAP
jgi:phosphoglycolate phosphatase